jgi:hypothetical protein
MCVADFAPLSPFVYQARTTQLGSHSDLHHWYQYAPRGGRHYLHGQLQAKQVYPHRNH